MMKYFIKSRTMQQRLKGKIVSRLAIPSLYVLASDVRWSEGAGSSGGAGPSTSGALPADSDFQYVCED